MIYKISGEQPFQIMASTFAIAQTSSGYTLLWSADGYNYDTLTNVAADTNFNVTGRSIGSYYILSGNTDDDVIVTTGRDCKPQQGGGGSGSGSTVSWSQVVTGGTKIAQISIDGASTDVYAPNGGGEQNYQIVDSLDDIETPYEGLKAYVKSKNYVTLDVYSFDVSQTSDLNDWFELWTGGGGNIFNSFYIRGGVLSGDFRFGIYTKESPDSRIQLTDYPNEWIEALIKEAGGDISDYKGKTIYAKFDNVSNALKFAVGFEIDRCTPYFDLTYDGQEEFEGFISAEEHIYNGSRWLGNTVVLNDMEASEIDELIDYINSNPDWYRFMDVYVRREVEGGYCYIKLTTYEVRTDASYGTPHFYGVTGIRGDMQLADVYFEEVNNRLNVNVKSLSDAVPVVLGRIDENGDFIDGAGSLFSALLRLAKYRNSSHLCIPYVVFGYVDDVAGEYSDEIGAVADISRLITVDGDGEHNRIRFSVTIGINGTLYKGRWDADPYNASDYEILEWGIATEGGGGTTFYKKSDIDQMTSSERADLFDELAARYEAGDFDFAIILEQSDWYSGLALRLYPSSYEAGSNIVFRGIYDLYGTKSAFDYTLYSDGRTYYKANGFSVLSNDAWRFDIDASGNCSGPTYNFCRCCGEENTGVNMYTFKNFGIGYKKPNSDGYTSYANILSRGFDDLAEVYFCVYTIEINGTLYIGRLSATYESSSITNDYFRPMFS